jgi:hypothetical protein
MMSDQLTFTRLRIRAKICNLLKQNLSLDDSKKVYFDKKEDELISIENSGVDNHLTVLSIKPCGIFCFSHIFYSLVIN